MTGGDDDARAAATAKQRQVWDQDAPNYDRRIAFLDRKVFGEGRARLGSLARGRVLEVAVGTGLSLPHYPPDLEVTGLDLSPNMLKIARSRAGELGRQVELREGDAQALPFADETFDTVLCALSLCNIPVPALAIAEMRRVLEPGGALLLLDHVGSSWPPVYALQWLVERVTVRSEGEYYTRRSLPLVQRAGFRIVESKRTFAGAVEWLHAVR